MSDMGVLFYYLTGFSVTAFFNKKHNYIPLLPFLVFAVFYCTRTKIGTDWVAYLAYFNNVHNTRYVVGRGFEPGFYFLNLVFSNMGLSYWNLVSFIGIITCIIYIKTANQLTKNHGLFFMISLFYFFYPSFESIRSSIAIILFFYSLSFIDNNLKKYCLLNILGFLFHSTALFALVFLIIYKFPIVKKYIYITIAVGTILVKSPFVVKIFRLLPKYIFKRFLFYFYYITLNKHVEDIISIKLFEYILILLICLIVMKYNARGKMIIGLLEIGIVSLVFVGLISNIAYRVTYYTDIGLILAYCDFYDLFKNELSRLLYIVAMIIYVFIRFYRVIG